jgi:hypothetical protein
MRARTADGGGEEATSAPGHEPRLDDLPTELLALVVGALPPEDEMAASLCCRKLHEAAAEMRAREGRAGSKTAAVSALWSVRRLEWGLSCGLPLSEALCERASRDGQLAQLRWLRAHGCPWDDCMCAAAAGGGHLNVLLWARANGSFWNDATWTIACVRHQLKAATCLC